VIARDACGRELTVGRQRFVAALNGVPYCEAVARLCVTRQDIWAIKSGKTRPSLSLAARIERWLGIRCLDWETPLR